MRWLHGTLLGVALGLIVWSAPGATVAAAELVNTTPDNIAIKGYDPVAYFVKHQPVVGSAKFEFVWQGARWRFANTRHRDLFAASPTSYAPRYGGFCSGGMSLGVKAQIDPRAWKIIDGKLFLASSKSVITDFANDAETNIAKANENWARIGHSD